jgi:hypothetical protein
MRGTVPAQRVREDLPFCYRKSETLKERCISATPGCVEQVLGHFLATDLSLLGPR